MSEPILIGTCGWEHAAWEGGFYPPALPADWRFCFFSNKIRSVIVPANAWAAIGPADVAQWVEDSDPAFRFVLELPPGLAASDDPARSLDAFFAMVAPIRDLTAALLLPLTPALATTPARLDALLAAARARHPVCVRAGTSEPAPVREYLRRRHASVCWDIGREPAPAPEGEFLVALMEQGDPRALRSALEHLGNWQGDARAAGLFFTGANAAETAQQARLLAELLDV